MSVFNKLFGEPRHKRSLLDDAQEVANKLIVKGYRRIGTHLGCAPTSRTTDEKIIELYAKVGTAFHETAKQRGEHIPALYLNNIVLTFLKKYELCGQKFTLEHLEYELKKYSASGLRPDYEQQLPLFDPNDLTDPDVKKLSELRQLTAQHLRK